LSYVQKPIHIVGAEDPSVLRVVPIGLLFAFRILVFEHIIEVDIDVELIVLVLFQIAVVHDFFPHSAFFCLDSLRSSLSMASHSETILGKMTECLGLISLSLRVFERLPHEFFRHSIFLRVSDASCDKCLLFIKAISFF
jgi:hypothetical protein